jgi:hypothetical protein
MDHEPRLYHGGLMRCCVETWLTTELPTEPGSTIKCKYCGSPIRRREDGDWEWDQEEALKNEPWFKRE